MASRQGSPSRVGLATEASARWEADHPDTAYKNEYYRGKDESTTAASSRRSSFSTTRSASSTIRSPSKAEFPRPGDPGSTLQPPAFPRRSRRSGPRGRDPPHHVATSTASPPRERPEPAQSTAERQRALGMGMEHRLGNLSLPPQRPSTASSPQREDRGPGASASGASASGASASGASASRGVAAEEKQRRPSSAGVISRREALEAARHRPAPNHSRTSPPRITQREATDGPGRRGGLSAGSSLVNSREVAEVPSPACLQPEDRPCAWRTVADSCSVGLTPVGGAHPSGGG
jgi:hypothetical protein